MKKWIVPVLSSIIISGCNPDSSKKDSEETSTKDSISHILTADDKKLDEGKEKTADFSSVNISKDTTLNTDISKSMIDSAIKGETDQEMNDILHTINQNNDRDNAKYIASNYKNYGYGTDAIGVMVDIAKKLGDFEKAKYVASNYQKYGYGGDAVGVMYSIANKISNRDKLSYIAQSYPKYGYASDCFVSMYDLYKRNPTPEKKELMIKLAQNEYRLWTSIINADMKLNNTDRISLHPDRERALVIAKELLGK